MVPFEKIGEAQVGRLVYQVIGKDGPIFNPQNISYLPPDAVNEFSGDIFNAAAGIAGLNLAATVGALTVTNAIRRDINRLHEKTNIIIQQTEGLQKTANEIQRKVNRIDMRVAENNLRSAMQHIFKKSISEDEIDLMQLYSGPQNPDNSIRWQPAIKRSRS